jgi:hypothetical protein
MLSLRVFGEDICKNTPLNKDDAFKADALESREGNIAGGGVEVDEEGAQNA